MPITYSLSGSSYLRGSYSVLFPTTASIGTITAGSVQITGITGPPNFKFNVIRNGTTIATGQTGSTYTDNTVSGNTNYTYQIQTSNQFGGGLPVSIGSLKTPSGLTTASGAAPLIAYSFTSANYTTINGTSGYYTNLANPGVDSFYTFNSLASGTVTSTYKFNYLNFSSDGGTSYILSTTPKGSIGNNNTTYSNTIASITSSTSYTSFTMTYWINVSSVPHNPLWNRFSGTGAGSTHDYQIYGLRQALENAGSGVGATSGSLSLNLSTWYFYAITLTGTTLYWWDCPIGGTFPSAYGSGGKGGGAQGVNANTYFVFGSSQWGDGNALFNMADLRIFGSALSLSDLTAMFNAGPNAN
jgi:hypothetical protein